MKIWESLNVVLTEMPVTMNKGNLSVEHITHFSYQNIMKYCEYNQQIINV